MKKKLTQLEKILRDCGSAAVAYSGGADSALLAHLCQKVMGREKCLACISTGPSLPERERRAAFRLAKTLGLRLETFQNTELEDPKYLDNPPERCFFCKSHLFEEMDAIRRKHGLLWVFYGGNTDDQSDFRPGHKAALAAGARAPLAEAGFTKADIRALSRKLGLPTHSKPSSPCLASRLPYGQAITVDKLHAVEKGEDLMFRLGFTDCRLRHEGDRARLEVPLAEMGILADPKALSRLSRGIKALGFKRVTLDLEGLRSGNLNADIVAKFTTSPPERKAFHGRR